MAQHHRNAILLALASILPPTMLAQNLPVLVISPSAATLTVGDSRAFRAVGRDGRMRRDVQWNVSPQTAVVLTVKEGEATLEAKEPCSKLVLSAQAGSDSAEAIVEIRSGRLDTGTILWSAPDIPGCKSRKISQAVPSADGPDLYVEEDCPEGTLVRAFTSDGREMWRTMLGGSTVPSSWRLPKPVSIGGKHLNFNHDSICDAAAIGMTKNTLALLLEERHMSLQERQQERAIWAFEEQGNRCELLFDNKTGMLVKKKKTLVVD